MEAKSEVDERCESIAIELDFKGQFYDEQAEAAKQILNSDLVIFAHRQFLERQWWQRKRSKAHN